MTTIIFTVFIIIFGLLTLLLDNYAQEVRVINHKRLCTCLSFLCMMLTVGCCFGAVFTALH